jgi:hypothetical protein
MPLRVFRFLRFTEQNSIEEAGRDLIKVTLPAFFPYEIHEITHF